MRKMRRFVSILLSMMMLTSMLPTSVLAADTEIMPDIVPEYSQEDAAEYRETLSSVIYSQGHAYVSVREGAKLYRDAELTDHIATLAGGNAISYADYYNKSVHIWVADQEGKAIGAYVSTSDVDKDYYADADALAFGESYGLVSASVGEDGSKTAVLVKTYVRMREYDNDLILDPIGMDFEDEDDVDLDDEIIENLDGEEGNTLPETGSGSGETPDEIVEYVDLDDEENIQDNELSENTGSGTVPESQADNAGEEDLTGESEIITPVVTGEEGKEGEPEEGAFEENVPGKGTPDINIAPEGGTSSESETAEGNADEVIPDGGVPEEGKTGEGNTEEVKPEATPEEGKTEVVEPVTDPAADEGEDNTDAKPEQGNQNMEPDGGEEIIPVESGEVKDNDAEASEPGEGTEGAQNEDTVIDNTSAEATDKQPEDVNNESEEGEVEHEVAPESTTDEALITVDGQESVIGVDSLLEIGEGTDEEAGFDEFVPGNFILVPAGTTIYSYIGEENNYSAKDMESRTYGTMVEDATIRIIRLHNIEGNIYIDCIALIGETDPVNLCVRADSVYTSDANAPTYAKIAVEKRAMLKGPALRAVATQSFAAYRKSPKISSNQFWEVGNSGFPGINMNNYGHAVSVSPNELWHFAGGSHQSIFWGENTVSNYETVHICILDNNTQPGHWEIWNRTPYITVFCIQPHNFKPTTGSQWDTRLDNISIIIGIPRYQQEFWQEFTANYDGDRHDYAGAPDRTGYGTAGTRFLKYVFRHGSYKFVSTTDDAFCHALQAAIGHYFTNGASWRNLYQYTADGDQLTQLNYAKWLLEKGSAFASLTPTITVEEAEPIKFNGTDYTVKLKITTNTDNGWAVKKSEMAAMNIKSISDAGQNSYAYYGESGTYTFVLNSLPTSDLTITIGAYESTSDIELYVWNNPPIQSLAIGGGIVPKPSAKASITLKAVGSMKITKVSSKNGAAMAGVSFTLKQGNTVIKTGTTNANGVLEFTGLVSGNYQLYENNIPAGYCFINAITNAVEYNSTSGIPYAVTSGNTTNVTWTNTEIKAPIEIIKKSSVNGHGVMGATFTIYDSTGAVAATVTTDENGYAKSEPLAYGKYAVKETGTPAGYKVEEPEFTVDITQLNTTANPVVYTVEATNTPEVSIEIPLVKTVDLASPGITPEQIALLRNGTYYFEISPINPYTRTDFGNTIRTPMPAEARISRTGPGNTSFGKISYEEPGIYMYKVVEIKGDQAINYDQSVHLVTVTVGEKKTESGETIFTASYATDGIENVAPSFLNDTDTTQGYTYVRIGVRKVLTGDALTEDTPFSFELESTDNSKMPRGTNIGEKAAVSATMRAGTQTVYFNNIFFQWGEEGALGEHNYTLREIIPEARKPGMEFDEDIHHIKIVVTQPDKTKNQLASSVTIDGEIATEVVVEFTNKYTTQPDTHTVVMVSKAIEGAPRPEEKNFTFKIEKDPSSSSDTPMPDQTTLTINGEGVGYFTGFTYTREGIFRYRVSEVIGTEKGYTYDKTVWNVTVDVIKRKNADGEYELASLTSYEKVVGYQVIKGSNAMFINQYQPDPTTEEFVVSKSIDGADRPDEKEIFEFTITPSDEASAEFMPATNTIRITDAGEQSFGPIKYTKAGTYTYVIAEKAGASDGYTYDNHETTVVVNVTDVGGELQSTWTADGNIVEKVSFTNEYQPLPVDWNLRVSKSITGNERPDAKETFRFELQKVEPADAPMPEENIINIVDAGTADYAAITFEKAGTYKYSVHEIAGSSTGYTYDDYTAQVEVEVKDKAGHLTVNSVKIDGVEVEDVTVATVVPFTNDYTPIPVDMEPVVKKVMTGEERRNSEKIDFAFTIAADDAELEETAKYPVPELRTVYVHDEGTASFGKIHFTKAGEYAYIVTEADARDRDYTCDKAMYKVTYTVVDNAGKLEATESIVRYEWNEEAAAHSETGTEAEEVIFTNEYVPYRGIVSLDKTGLRFIDTQTITDKYGFTYTKPVFENRFVAGVTVNIYAADTIYAKDGSVWFEKDALAGTIVTTSAGSDKSEELPFGNYYLVEQSAPNSYVFTDEKVPITLAYKSADIVKVEMPCAMYNDYIMADILVTKDQEDTEIEELESGMIHQKIVTVPGSGIVFGVFTAEEIAGDGVTLPADTLVSTGITNTEGQIHFQQYLPHGKYYVQELKTKDGWYLNTEKYPISVTRENLDETDNLIKVAPTENIYNELKYKKVTITKKELTSEATVPGALIEVYDEDGNTVYREYTDENGEIPDMPLKVGKYTFKEVLAPEYYALNVAVLNFEVIETEDGLIVHGDTDIRDDFTRVSFQKIDRTVGEPLEGVEFTLFNEEHEAIISTVSDEEGNVVFEKIPYGKFTIEETKLQDGYIPLKGSIFEAFVVDGTFVNRDAEAEPIKVENEQNEIRILKVDQDGKSLAGARFGLYNEAGDLIKEVVSGKDGIVSFRKLPFGTYEVKEIEAVNGYLLCKTVFKVTIDADYVNPTEPQATFINRLKRIKYIKTDTSGKYLAGVEFALISKETGKTVETVKSDANGVFTFTKFDYGDWIIRETKAPAGYNVMPDISLHVGDDWVEPAPFTCVDIPNHYEFVKTDNNGNPLPGVKFTLENGNGKVLGTYVSDSKGIVKVTNLTPGKYVIREIETVKGFVLTDEVIVIEINEKYVVPEKMFQLINYPVIQTGVEFENPNQWIGIALLALALCTGGILLFTKKRKAHKG